MTTSFQYIGDKKKVIARGVLFKKKKAVPVENGQLAEMLRERNDFKEVTDEPKEKTAARSPKDDAKQS